MSRQLTQFLLVLLLCCSTALGQQETGHYPAGAEGIKGATLPPPGKYLKWYNFYYSADKLTGAGGRKINAGLDLDVFATAPRFIWMTEKKLFGADYGMDILVPFVQIDLKTTGNHASDAGVGDIFVEPVVLGWHGDSWDVGAAAGIWMPTGEFDAAQPVNVGKGFWTTMLTFGATGYLDEDKKWSMSGLGRYEINSEKSGIAIRPGDDFHIEWGLGRTFHQNWTIGVSSYTHWQVTDDRGSAVTYNANVHDRFASLGPELGWASDDSTCFLSIRCQREFGAVDRTQGTNTVLSFVKVF